jgi:hypothetical protein
MSKFLSGRQSNLKLGVAGYTESKTVLETTGKVGIGTTDAGDFSLYVIGPTNIQGNTLVGGALTVTGPLSAPEISVTGTNTVIGDDITTRHLKVTGIGTFDNNVDVDGSLDVDGFTQLDGLNVDGVTTLDQTTVDGTFTVNGHTELDDVNVGGYATVTSLRVNTNFDVYDSVATIHNDLYIGGNLSIGGTTTVLQAQDLKIFDKDIILGVTTDAYGNDISTDVTANHAGVAVASTTGFPLVDLTIAGLEELPATYKKIMWFREGTFAGLGTDAWLFNYAVGIGSTQFPSGTRLAVEEIQFTGDTIKTPNLRVNDDLTVSGGISTDGVNYGIDGQILKSISGEKWEWATVPGLFSVNNILNGFNILEEGSSVGTAGSITTIDFRGINVTASADPAPNGIATVTFSTTPTFTDITVTGNTTIPNVTGITTFSNNVHVGSSITMYAATGIVSATAFYGDGSNLENTGATLNATSGVERLVTTQLTSGTMVDAATDADLTFNAGNNTLSVPNISVVGFSSDGTNYGNNGFVPVANGSGGWTWTSIQGASAVNTILNGFTVRDEGSVVGTAGSITQLDFSGVNILASADIQPNGIATITMSETPTFQTLDVSGISTFGGQISVGGTEGIDGQYLRSTGVGVTWASFPTLRTTQTNVATAGQAVFNFVYNVNFLDVFVNGVKLSSSEYQATNGTQVTLSTPAYAGEIVEFHSYNTVSTGSGGGGGGGGGGGASLLNDLGDVTIGTLSNDQILQYNSVNGQWENGTLSLVTGRFSDNQTNSGIHTTSSNVGLGTTNPRFQTEIGHVGAAGTQLWVNGDARITGILSVGTATITLDPNTNKVQIGTGITINASTNTIEIGGSQISGVGGNSTFSGIVTATSFAKSGGTSSQFLKADGSIDASTYSTTTAVGLATSGLASETYVGLSTAGFASETFVGLATAGLASETYVGLSTAGLASESYVGLSTAGLASETYVGLATAGLLSETGDGSQLTGITSTTSEWTLGANASSDYTFTGPGVAAGAQDPTIYLVRGQTYKFKNRSGGHPFRIQYQFQNTGGTAYTDGISISDGSVASSGAGNGEDLYWEVRNDAPDILYYQCTSHSDMSGKIVILGDIKTNGSWTASAGTPQVIDTITVVSNNAIKTAEYTIHFEYDMHMQSQKILVMQNGITAHHQEYAVMYTSTNPLVELSADINSGNLRLLATPATGVNGTTTYTFTRQTIR